MGWRFRRTIRTGPVQTVLTKNGIGWSLNLGICRVGVSPFGQPFVSFGLPGTGLYFIKYLGGGKNQQPPPSMRNITPPPAQPPPPNIAPVSQNQALLDRMKKELNQQP